MALLSACPGWTATGMQSFVEPRSTVITSPRSSRTLLSSCDVRCTLLTRIKQIHPNALCFLNSWFLVMNYRDSLNSSLTLMQEARHPTWKIPQSLSRSQHLRAAKPGMAIRQRKGKNPLNEIHTGARGQFRLAAVVVFMTKSPTFTTLFISFVKFLFYSCPSMKKKAL